MKTVGLDLSINSTGVCYNSDGKCKYWLIVPANKMTKKMREIQHKQFQYLNYDKDDTRAGDYTCNEYNKSVNAYRWMEVLRVLLKWLKRRGVDYVVMEGVSYGSTSASSLVDLAGVQYLARVVCQELGMVFFVVSPTSNKKLATGNGNATKEEMVYAWERCDGTLKDMKGVKVDDLADAYFLSTVVMS